MNLIEELTKREIIDRSKVTSLLQEIKESGQREEEIILEKRLVPESVLYEIKGEILGVDLKTISVNEISSETLELIPKDSAQYYRMIPVKKKDNLLEIGMVYPDDLRALEALKFLARQQDFEYRVFLITPSNFNEIFRKYQSLKKEVKTALEDLEKQLQIKKVEKEISLVRPEDIGQRIAEAPISKMVAVILRHSIEGGASDIHVEPIKDRTRVRFRLDGVLHSSLFLPQKIHPSIVSRIKIIANLRIDETRIPQDGRFSIAINEQNIDFRVSTFPTFFGEKVVMRVLNPQKRLQNFDSLGLRAGALEVLKGAIASPYGMLLATGPTGCGKTTTLYVVLESLNKEGANIITLEDPIEYYIEGINQSQVKPEIGYNFANGLRHVLRQDPDIIMVGEIRDSETAELAIHAALTGHLVISTLHTNNAVGVIPRLIDLGVKPFLIPATLNVVLAQRLVRRVCQKCKKRIVPDLKIREIISESMVDLPARSRRRAEFAGSEFYVWKGEGCIDCGGTGYSGRIGLFEILKMTKELSKIILSQPNEEKILREAKKQGMLTMRQDGILKAMEGLTAIEEIIGATEFEY